MTRALVLFCILVSFALANPTISNNCSLTLFSCLFFQQVIYLTLVQRGLARCMASELALTQEVACMNFFFFFIFVFVAFGILALRNNWILNSQARLASIMFMNMDMS